MEGGSASMACVQAAPPMCPVPHGVLTEEIKHAVLWVPIKIIRLQIRILPKP